MKRLLSRNPYRELEKAIGYSFRKRRLLTSALTHRSYRFETPHVETDNQRLEFLGDAVLGFLAAAHIYHLFEHSQEGELTTARSRITSGKALSAVARDLDIGKHMHVGKGEDKSGGRRRSSTLADALEAIIGAAYVDGGIKSAEKVFKKIIAPLLETGQPDEWADNPKGQLQALSQSLWHESPHYQVVAHEGPAHAREFTVEVSIRNKSLGRGTGGNKRSAERYAALAALHKLAHRRPGHNVHE